MDKKQRRQYRRRVRAASSELFELAKQRDVDALIALLQSPLETENISIRFGALMHLGKLGAREAIPHIVPFLTDRDYAMRAGAVVALTRLDARSAIGAIVPALADEYPGVRQRTAEGLGILGAGNPVAVAALVRALDDEVRHVRWAALASLASLGDGSAVPAIEALARRERPWRRRHAWRALRALRNNGAPT